MLETLCADFIRTGHAKGLRPARVVLLHALSNAMLPIISIIGLRFGALLGGAVLTETIFNWPGLGQLVVTAILQRDIPLVQGVVLVFAFLYALTNLAGGPPLHGDRSARAARVNAALARQILS